MIAGLASGKIISLIIVQGCAPTDTAASITPRSISLAADSTILAKNGIAATDNGTEAAVGPIVVPTNRSVNGSKKTSNIINGIERTKLVINTDIDLIHLFSIICPWSVTYNTIPKCIPSIIATATAMPTIYKVWKNALLNSGEKSIRNSMIPMLYHLHLFNSFLQIINCLRYIFFITGNFH